MYNVIFPVWLLWLVPPVILVVALGNFVVDSLVLLLSCRLVTGKLEGRSLWSIYRHSILKIWRFGFLADFIGSFPLIAVMVTDRWAGLIPLPGQVELAFMLNPWLNGVALLLVSLSVALAGILVFVFNYRFALRGVIREKGPRLKIALVLAVLTAPYTLLIPTEWLYY